ncbi:MAPEG family protein [Paracoccus sediminicola]|uniref:MAPEG family protein n=1 Tax=Paracoccus sediminicola TaxID=3017783 RepID=UPI0022F127D1|nr:MAPEG family protein [Paracoccus sediminicola]WBU58304.1 MAPEG family protein [Paracoccus sediminicola]
MTTELTVLALAGLLQACQFALFAIRANLELGPAVTMGPRDKPVQLSKMTGRLQRAMANHFEGLALFTIAVVVVTLADESSWLTASCAWIYLIARVLYVPAYAFGWTPWRSVIWVVGFAATMLMILAALF